MSILSPGEMEPGSEDEGEEKGDEDIIFTDEVLKIISQLYNYLRSDASNLSDEHRTEIIEKYKQTILDLNDYIIIMIKKKIKGIERYYSLKLEEDLKHIQKEVERLTFEKKEIQKKVVKLEEKNSKSLTTIRQQKADIFKHEGQFRDEIKKKDGEILKKKREIAEITNTNGRLREALRDTEIELENEKRKNASSLKESPSGPRNLATAETYQEFVGSIQDEKEQLMAKHSTMHGLISEKPKKEISNYRRFMSTLAFRLLDEEDIKSVVTDFKEASDLTTLQYLTSKVSELDSSACRKLEKKIFKEVDQVDSFKGDVKGMFSAIQSEKLNVYSYAKKELQTIREAVLQFENAQEHVGRLRQELKEINAQVERTREAEVEEDRTLQAQLEWEEETKEETKEEIDLRNKNNKELFARAARTPQQGWQELDPPEFRLDSVELPEGKRVSTAEYLQQFISSSKRWRRELYSVKVELFALIRKKEDELQDFAGFTRYGEREQPVSIVKHVESLFDALQKAERDTQFVRPVAGGSDSEIGRAERAPKGLARIRVEPKNTKRQGVSLESSASKRVERKLRKPDAEGEHTQQGVKQLQAFLQSKDVELTAMRSVLEVETDFFKQCREVICDYSSLEAEDLADMSELGLVREGRRCLDLLKNALSQQSGKESKLGETAARAAAALEEHQRKSTPSEIEGGGVTGTAVSGVAQATSAEPSQLHALQAESAISRRREEEILREANRTLESKIKSLESEQKESKGKLVIYAKLNVILKDFLDNCESELGKYSKHDMSSKFKRTLKLRCEDCLKQLQEVIQKAKSVDASRFGEEGKVASLRLTQDDFESFLVCIPWAQNQIASILREMGKASDSLLVYEDLFLKIVQNTPHQHGNFKSKIEAFVDLLGKLKTDFVSLLALSGRCVRDFPRACELLRCDQDTFLAKLKVVVEEQWLGREAAAPALSRGELAQVLLSTTPQALADRLRTLAEAGRETHALPPMAAQLLEEPELPCRGEAFRRWMSTFASGVVGPNIRAGVLNAACASAALAMYEFMHVPANEDLVAAESGEHPMLEPSVRDADYYADRWSRNEVQSSQSQHLLPHLSALLPSTSGTCAADLAPAMVWGVDSGRPDRSTPSFQKSEPFAMEVKVDPAQWSRENTVPTLVHDAEGVRLFSNWTGDMWKVVAQSGGKQQTLFLPEHGKTLIRRI